MTIFTSNRRERLLQNSLLSSRFDNLLVFSIPPCSQKVISQGSVLASILLGAFLPVEVFNDMVRGLFTPLFSTEKLPRTSVLTEASQFASQRLPFLW